MYDEHYGLSGRPFQLTPDPEFYFESASHRKALSYLGYGLSQGEGFIVITGEVGAGKSILVAHLLAMVDRQRLTAAQIVTSALDGGELVHVAARAFGLAVGGHDKPSALAALERFLQDEARAGRRCLLVVDESQSLMVAALEELRMLSNFQLGAHPLLQILLLGQPEFRDLLQRSPELEQLRQRVIATHHLEPLGADEVGPYVEHRLSRVGWDGRPAFAAELWPELARASGGLPRRINQIANRLLLLGAVERRDSLDAATLRTALADLRRDGAAEPAPRAPAAAPAAVEHADASALDAALAGRDELIRELQQAIVELSDARRQSLDDEPSREEVLGALAEAAQRVAALEARVLEQERTIRHTLTMLIEWIEGDDPHLAAA